jgi:hypothetical protein
MGLFWPGLVRAAQSDHQVSPPELEYADEDAEPEPGARVGPVLEAPSKFGVDVEGYAGIAAQITEGDNRAHGILGGLLRARFHYVQLGGTFEITDSGQATGLLEESLEHWRAIGGFAGAFLPFNHWVDFDAAVGVSARTYKNSNKIYGDAGMNETVPSLTFRFGVSDRMTKKLVGPRIGAALALGIDLSHSDVEWRRVYGIAGGGTAETIGTTAIGGVSIGLLVGGGFEIGGREP